MTRTGDGRIERFRRRVRHSATALRRVLFGDGLGVLVFAVTVLFVASFWRMDLAINDNQTLANGVRALTNGHLRILDPHFGGNNGIAPGTKYHDGARYAREYGLVVPAAIISVLLHSLAHVLSLSVLLVGAWCLLGVVAIDELTDGRRYEDELRLGARLGMGVLFVGNVLLAAPIDPVTIPVVSLQLWTLLCTGFVATLAYRLFELELPRRVAAAVGVGVVVATPVGFWATVPKRHVVVALAVLVAAYAFARQPSVRGARGRLLRTVPYATAGLLAWVHPGDGAIFFVAVCVVDVVFGTAYDRAQVTLASGVFVLSLLPFFVTNLLVSGNPVRPPQFLPQYDGQPLGRAVPDETTGETGGGGSGTGTPSETFVPGVLARIVVEAAVAALTTAGGFLRRAVRYAEGTFYVFVDSPQRVFQTFVRSGYVERAAVRGASFSYNLAYLESMPLLGPAVLGTIHAVRHAEPLRRVANGGSLVFRDADASTRVLALAGVYFSLMVLFYQERLPLHSTLTVRFLVPTMPLAVYAALRLPALRNVLLERFRTVGMAYAVTVLVGGELFAGVLVLLSPTVGEAVQLHALVALAMAGTLSAWCIVVSLDGRWLSTRNAGRVGAVLLGTTAGTTTVFLLLAGWMHFPYGEYAIPIFDALSELLRS
ncbi:hypothetical protein [Halorubellus salinus]|uniref:hypothetical protein n=1 Tax=Halorubellus salinus TaxID=755309 RepID=UPI001D0699BB|nr:hypothetical protein [Halorubellus salinus]